MIYTNTRYNHDGGNSKFIRFYGTTRDRLIGSAKSFNTL